MNQEAPDNYDNQAPMQPPTIIDPTQYAVVGDATKGKPWAAMVAVIAAAVSLLTLLPFVFYSLTAANDPAMAPFAYLFFILVPVSFIVVPATAITAMIMAALAKPKASKKTRVILLITNVILALDVLAVFLMFYN